MIADIIRNINLFVEGQGYAGKIEELTLPKLTPLVQEYKAGGMSAPIDVLMGGHEKLEAELSLKAFDPKVLKLFRVNPGKDISFVARGALQDETGTIKAVSVTLRGFIKEYDMGAWKAADEVQLKLGLSLNYYRLEYAGDTIIESDPVNMVLKIDGVDQLAETRSAIGL